MYDLWFLSQENADETWDNFRQKYPHAKRKIINKGLDEIILECANQSYTIFFWTVLDTLDIDPAWDFTYEPPTYDKKYLNVWSKNSNNKVDLECMILWPRYQILEHGNPVELLKKKIKIHKKPVAIQKKYDLFFISYEEETAEENWQKFQTRFPQARRIHRIYGIDNAHRLCAFLANNDMFWTVDADTIIDDSWDFSFVPPNHDQRYLHLWYSLNPINNLAYGYGSVKLWPKNKVLDFASPFIDFTTSVGNIKIHQDVISTTVYNTSEYSTWKSAFRECIKLQHNIEKNKDDIESVERLEKWETIFNDVPFVDWARQGVVDARLYYKDNNKNLNEINNFDWLKGYFLKHYPKVKI